MRAPRVCGVEGGVGTTTIAAALKARDVGVYHEGPADIIVCRTTSTSVAMAHAVVDTVPGKPVLVVVADGPLHMPPPAKARLTMVRPHITALVTVPYVQPWREIDQALEQARLALWMPPEQVPKWLRPWATALREIMNAVLPLVEHEPRDAAGDVLPSLPVNGHPSAPPDPTAVPMRGSGPLPPSAAGN